MTNDKIAANINTETVKIMEATEALHGRVCGCVADNARNMQSALRMITEDKFLLVQYC